jgi:hypothetical protein
VISFVVLAILMVASFIVSEYEYNKVQEKYQIAFNEANATLHNQTVVNGTLPSMSMLESAKMQPPHKKHHRHHSEERVN